MIGLQCEYTLCMYILYTAHINIFIYVSIIVCTVF